MPTMSRCRYRQKAPASIGAVIASMASGTPETVT